MSDHDPSLLQDKECTSISHLPGPSVVSLSGDILPHRTLNAEGIGTVWMPRVAEGIDTILWHVLLWEVRKKPNTETFPPEERRSGATPAAWHLSGLPRSDGFCSASHRGLRNPTSSRWLGQQWPSWLWDMEKVHNWGRFLTMGKKSEACPWHLWSFRAPQRGWFPSHLKWGGDRADVVTGGSKRLWATGEKQ